MFVSLQIKMLTSVCCVNVDAPIPKLACVSKLETDLLGPCAERKLEQAFQVLVLSAWLVQKQNETLLPAPLL